MRAAKILKKRSARPKRETVVVRTTVLPSRARQADAASIVCSSPPRTRADVDVALQSIGLEIDTLLDNTQLPDDACSDEPDLDLDLPTRLRRLFEDAEVDARSVDVIVEGERVTLLGRVGDAVSRLLAEDLAWSLPDVNECDNRLAVG